MSEALRLKHLILKRQQKALRARDNFIDYCEFMSPDPEDPDDAGKSAYEVGDHHRFLAQKLERIEQRKSRFLIVTEPPRHGKSEQASIRFPAWYSGRNPHHHIILASATGDLAQTFGLKMRTICNSGPHRQVFPDYSFSADKMAADEMWTTKGGQIRIAGIGGMITGYGAHLFVLDDPFKDRPDAMSRTQREKVWNFFTSVALTRLMPGGAMVIVLTRWHEDDVVGRLFDEAYIPKEISDQFEKVDLPALAREDDPLGRPVGAALWPQKFPVSELHMKRAMMPPEEWSALYQQVPADEDGSIFTRDMIRTYTPNECPPLENLRVYVSSDHALTQKEANDASVFLTVGVDSAGRLWILDCWWKRAESPAQIDQMMTIIKEWKPYTWFATADHISKSILPLLRMRMREEHSYCHFEEIPERKDLVQRSAAIRGRMSSGMVMFPKHAPWLSEAINEMLKMTPSGSAAKHDDFVAALSLMGMGMDKQIMGSPVPANRDDVVRLHPHHPCWAAWSSRRERKHATEGSLKWMR